MSEEQLAALLAKLKDDAGLQEKLKGAADLDAVLAIATEAGFEISKAAWLRYQANQTLELSDANQTLELSDEELEGVAGGNGKGVAGKCMKNSGETQFANWECVYGTGVSTCMNC